MTRLYLTILVAFSLLALYSCSGDSNASKGEGQSAAEPSSSASNHPPKLKIGDSQPSDQIRWYDYDEGIRKLTGTPKFGILYFDTADCAPCQWMQDSLFSNPDIIKAINKDFIAIKVQTARNDTLHYQGMAFTESYLRKIFALAGYPTTIFIEGSTNQMVGGMPSIIYPDRMLDMMGYMTSNAYKSMEFKEYVDMKHGTQLEADSTK